MFQKRIYCAGMVAVLACGSLVARAQTSVGLSFYGAFNGMASTANGGQQSPANAAGGLIEVRHISNPILGVEGTYSYNRANQTYSCPHCVYPLPCPTSGCTGEPAPASISANAHELTVDWVPSLGIGSFRPFGVLGIGALFDVPAGGANATDTKTDAVYVYGAGLDWGVLPHVGLRFQYRGNLYRAPDLTTLYSSTGAFTHTAEPMIGLYFSL